MPLHTSRLRGNNPATGRYTTPDPSGKEKNTYLYAAGNTCNKTDPRGEFNKACAAGILGAVSIAGLTILAMMALPEAAPIWADWALADFGSLGIIGAGVGAYDTCHSDG